MIRPFSQVDVFGSEPLLGNAVAVVVDAGGLTDKQMLQFAIWTNLSETTFILPPDDPQADYHVRIFTPGGEVPFAGHPTLGSAHAWLEAGGVPHRPGHVIQQCAAGLVELVSGETLAFAAPPPTRTGPLDDDLVAVIALGLGVDRDVVLDHQWVVNGPTWVCLRLPSADQVLLVEPDFALLARLGLDIGIIGFYPPGSQFLYEMRAFPLALGVNEDPVTGSLQASVAQWLHRIGEVPDTYVTSQGVRVGHSGHVHIHADQEGKIWVGGTTQTLISGTVVL